MPYDVIMLTERALPFGSDEVTFSHSAGSPDYSRVAKGQVQLLADHTASLENTIGTVLSANTRNRATVGQVDVFDIPGDPLSAKASYMFKQAEENGRTIGLSVGILNLSEPRRLGPSNLGGSSYMVDNWTLGELSVVPLPRDDNARVDLSTPYIINTNGSKTHLSLPTNDDAQDAILSGLVRHSLAARQSVVSAFAEQTWTLYLPVILNHTRR